MIPDLVARLRVLRDAPGTPRDAPQTHRTAFWARFGLTSTCTPVFASLLGRFLAISMSRAGRPTGVPYAFLQVETHVAPFALRERVRSGNGRKSIANRSENRPEIAARAISGDPSEQN